MEYVKSEKGKIENDAKDETSENLKFSRGNSIKIMLNEKGVTSLNHLLHPLVWTYKKIINK
jgi:hypothetical protein